MTHCYELGLGARTVYDKLVTVLQLFKKHGRAGLMEKGDWPKYVDAIRPIYEPEELQAMFNAATEDEADLLKFILGSGFRDQEIRYVEYLDLDFRHHLARVTAKARWGFTPKNWEERTVPLPAGLMERLRKRKERKQARPHDLVFGNTKGRPDSEMDMVVKRVAERARLNCGQCVTEHGNKCAEGTEIEARLVAEAHAKGVEPSVYAGSMIERIYFVNGTRRPSRNPEEVRAWLDSLTQFSDKIPQLPDEAFTRESFYQGHE